MPTSSQNYLPRLSSFFLVWIALASRSTHGTSTNNNVAVQHLPTKESVDTRLVEQESLQNSPELQRAEEKGSQRVLLRPRSLAGSTMRPWLQEHFPSPETNAGICRATKSHRLCDPDGVLSPTGLEKVEEFLEEKWYIYRDLCTETARDATSTQDNINEKREGLEIQMAVALVEQMDLSPFGMVDDREERAAETFARYVHDQWGVGVETESCGGAGILLFLSIRDRAIYISRGSALETTLIDRRLDQVMDNMKDLLRSEQYDDAILQALQDMRQYIEQGPPSTLENAMHLFVTMVFPLMWMCAVFACVMKQARHHSRQTRDYARVASQLNEIDRARAEALQGKYRATSCPICLEDFEAPETEGQLSTKGSDGQPIKLLRCGHCMDESCWAEWISSGRGTITKCPICQQDIGAEDGGNATQSTNQGGGHHNNVNHNNHNRNRNDQNAIRNYMQNEILDDQEDENRMMRQYRRERNFRLARLGYRYPQIIRPNQIQRWTQPTYDGTLVRDPSFVQSNPTVRTAARGGGSSSRSSGFGGSFSGGGRGGRW